VLASEVVEHAGCCDACCGRPLLVGSAQPPDPRSCYATLARTSPQAAEDEGETHAERLARLKQQAAEAAAASDSKASKQHKKKHQKAKVGKRERAELKAAGVAPAPAAKKTKAGGKAAATGAAGAAGAAGAKYKHLNASALRRKERRDVARAAMAAMAD
jgi:hypothetical protein